MLQHTTSRTRASVSSLLGLLIATLAKVVGAGMHDDSPLKRASQYAAVREAMRGREAYANDTLGADELYKLVRDCALAVALSIGLEVSQITDVAFGISLVSVGLAVGVKVRAGRGAAVCVVAIGMDVHATLGVGIVAGDVVGDGRLAILRLLLECDCSGDLGITTKDGN